MNKKFFLIILLIISIFFCVFIFNKNYYSLNEVKLLISQKNILPKNLHIIGTYYDETNMQIASFDTYIKNNLIYTSQYNNIQKYAETLTDINNYNINIIHDTKNIIYETNYKYTYNGILTIEDAILFKKINKNTFYKYCGKEKIENINCIKFSLFINNYDNVELTYYYIDLINGNIIKLENYIGNTLDSITLKSSANYKYIYNSVSDANILNFDKNNYKDYEYNEI